MSMGAAALAGAATGGALFDYNRQNFMYDRKMRQETEYQIMDFRIKQAELWREDVRDIVGLTSVKMDTYLIVNAVQLGFCVMAFCEGRLAAGTPTWLIGCHTLALAGAFMYLLMSVWLAMHASVTAKSYEVRLLTQLVRLPVPSWAQIEGARTYGSGYEKTDPKQMFRVPFAMGAQEHVLQSTMRSGVDSETRGTGPGMTPPPSVGRASGPTPELDGIVANAHADGVETADVWGLEKRGDDIYELDGSVRADPSRLRHLRLVREAMQYWQSYDGFARVAMSVGTNQLIGAMAYYVIGYVLISNHAVIAAWIVVILFMVLACALIRLDMSLTIFEYRLSVLLVSLGPCCIAVAAEQWSRHTVVGFQTSIILPPIAYISHAMWLMFLLHISNVKEQKSGALLPTGFRSVMYIDVFGWIKRQRNRRNQDAAVFAPPPPADAVGRVSGNGPAVQAVQYQMGRPVPSRPEDLPGAAQSPFALEGLTREDFEPSTFVPREKHGETVQELHIIDAKPGFVPWRIFCSATVLLIALWWITGAFVLLEACGLTALKIPALLREPDEETVSGIQASANQSTLLQQGFSLNLQNGVHIPTKWPLDRIRPHSLTCSDSGGGMLLSLSEFGMFAAHLQHPSGGRSVEFVSKPLCEDTEGESLRDVALSCQDSSSPDGCQALVLHRQGRRLSACDFSAAPAKAGNSSATMPTTMSLVDAWLSDGSSADGIAQEEITSITLADRCRNPGVDVDTSRRCAFVETSKRRIVEMQSISRSNGERDWSPTRILQVEPEGSETKRGGALHLIGGRYLGILKPDAHQLDVLDPQDGTVLGQWHLPEDQQWSAMCGQGDNLYFLTDGLTPQLWRFPMPEPLRHQQHTKSLRKPRVKQEYLQTSAAQAAHVASRKNQMLALAMAL